MEPRSSHPATREGERSEGTHVRDGGRVEDQNKNPQKANTQNPQKTQNLKTQTPKSEITASRGRKGRRSAMLRANLHLTRATKE